MYNILYKIFKKEDYCPIKSKILGRCGSNKLRCDHIGCWEKIHYKNPTKTLEEKMSKWNLTRKKDGSRWEKRNG